MLFLSEASGTRMGIPPRFYYISVIREERNGKEEKKIEISPLGEDREGMTNK